MPACPHCSAANRPGARFCAGCGARLEGVAADGAALAARPCPACGRANRRAARFCAACSARLEGAPAAPAGAAARLCPGCGRANKAQARFCAGCGAAFCPACGHANKVQARFCARCGRTLARPTPPALSPSMPVPGLVAGRYRILREVGRGGMGIVYEAEDTGAPGMPRRALKRLLVETAKPADLPELIEGFRREAELLMALDHPSLVKGYACFGAGGQEYLVMDFIAGKTLAALVNHTPLNESLALDFGAQLCDVLGYLHSRRPPIIYRDMKPSNVMLETANGRVKLLDFGAARIFKPGKLRDTVAIGTKGFAAPEQYGKSQTDARSDVYALGATLYVLLTNYDVEQNPLHFPPIRSLNAAVSRPLADVIHRAVQVRADDRYRSMEEMGVALAECPAARRSGQ